MRSVLFTMLLLLLVPAAFAQTPQFGLGIILGSEVPILQDDQATGPIYGARARIGAPIVTIEPYFTFTAYGDPDLGIAGVTNDLAGSEISAYGVDVVLGGAPGTGGLSPIFIGGAGFYSASREGAGQFGAFDSSSDGTRFGFSGGVGLMFGVTPKIDLDVRGKLIVIPIDGGGSDKAVAITGGITYNLGM